MLQVDNEESTLIREHIPCLDPECGSSDACCEYSDGHFYCFSCGKYFPAPKDAVKETQRKPKRNSKLLNLEDLKLIALKARGITMETCRKYGYFVGTYKGHAVQVACYFDDMGDLIGQKLRTPDKDFVVLGKVGDRFFGQHLFPGGGKKVVITEGEIDAETASQVQGNKYPVVSVPCGAKSAKKTFKAQIEWLESFDEVITMFDMDDEGEKARKDVEGLLSPGKLRHAYLPLKDPNECLLAERPDEIIRAIWNAKVWKPGGIVNGAELWDKLNERQESSYCVPWPWENLDIQKMTQGIRMGEMLLVTAGTGIGKSTIFRELAYYFGVTFPEAFKVGMIFLEEQNTETALALMSLHMNRRLHLSWNSLSAEDRRRAFEETLGTERFVFYDHFGSLDGESLLQKIRYMAAAEGCKFIFLDHISIAISGLESSNERKDIDVLMTNLMSLIQETGVGIGVICHLKKTEDKKEPFEEGGRISLDDLRGSGTLKQIPNTIIAGERNQQEENEKAKNLVRLRVLKCRFTGKTGIAGHLWFNEETGRLEAVEKVEEFIEDNPEEDLEDCPSEF